MTTCPICRDPVFCVYQSMPDLEDNLRYFVGGQPVTQAEYVEAERKAGFFNTLGHPEKPSTAGFAGSNGIKGRVEYGAPE